MMPSKQMSSKMILPYKNGNSLKRSKHYFYRSESVRRLLKSWAFLTLTCLSQLKVAEEILYWLRFSALEAAA